MLASLRRAAVIVAALLFAGPGAAQPPRMDRLGDPLPPGAVARFGTPRFRHDDTIGALAFAPDGRTLASGGDDRSVCLWDAATGKLERKLSGHERPVRAVVFGPDGSLLASATDSEVCVWSMAKGQLLCRLPGKVKGRVNPSFSADGKWLAVADRMSARVVEARTGKERCVIKGKGAVRNLALAPDGSLLAVSDDNAVRLYDLATGKKMHTYEGHEEDSAPVVAFAPDGKRLASADANGVIIVWETASDEALVSFTVAEERAAWELWFENGGKTLTVLLNDGRVSRHAAADGKQLEILGAEEDKGRKPLALSADGKRLASAAGNVLHVRDLTTGKVAPDLGQPEQIADVAWLPRGLALWTEKTDLLFWDPAGAGAPRRLVGPEGDTFLPCVSADGRFVVTLTSAGGFRVLSATTGKVVSEGQPPEGTPVIWAAFVPDGRGLVVGGEKGLFLFDARTGRQRLSVSNAKAPDFAAVLSADGRTLFTLAEPQDLCLWEVATGKERRRVPLDALPSCLAVSPNSADLAAGEEGGEVRLYSLGRGVIQHKLSGHKGMVCAIAFSPGGKLLATGGADGFVRLWDPATGRAMRRLDGLGGPVSRLAFSADGKSLVTVGGGTTVLVWDVAEVLALPLPTPPLRSLADLWADLASDDAARADAAIRALVDRPGEALLLLKDRLRPVVPVEAGVLARLREDLDSDDFGTRQSAAKELRALGHLAEPALRRLLEGKPSPEVRRAAEEMLALLDDSVPDPERLRVLRGVEALEAMGTPEARQALKTLATGAAGARLTEEARAVSERLRRRADAPR